ncbi:MAG: nucleotide exchange factor GrpE [Ahrensia sp.]|nr:nucleotide exchange factor GrpE [Ahrensia sp.]
MAEDNNSPEQTSGSSTSPSARERLRKVADELLRADRKAARREAAQDADTFADLDADEFDEDGNYIGPDPDQENLEPQIDPIETLMAENADLKDRLLRLAAEMENLRARTKREVADAKIYSVANFARDMLGVSDNFQRAIDAVPADKRESGSPEFKSLIEGVEITEKSMLSTMDRHGVKKLEPEGEKFDPNFHQAMFEIPNTEVPNNTVLQVVQAGYRIGDRVLRPALVGVSKGGPKAAATPSADDASDTDGV